MRQGLGVCVVRMRGAKIARDQTAHRTMLILSSMVIALSSFAARCAGVSLVRIQGRGTAASARATPTNNNTSATRRAIAANGSFWKQFVMAVAAPGGESLAARLEDPLQTRHNAKYLADAVAESVTEACAQLSAVRPGDPLLWLARFLLGRSAHPEAVAIVPVGRPLRLTELPRAGLALILRAGFLDARDLVALDASARAFSSLGVARAAAGARAFRAASSAGAAGATALSLTEGAARRTLLQRTDSAERGGDEPWKRALWRAERGVALAAPPAESATGAAPEAESATGAAPAAESATGAAPAAESATGAAPEAESTGGGAS